MRQKNSPMTSAMEHLVRLMILIPHEVDHPLWKSMIDDCGGASAVMSMRWFVGDTVKMWPPAGPQNLAATVLTVFDTPSDTTLRLLSQELATDQARESTRPGQAWVDEARATAVRVLAQAPDLDAVLAEVRAHWTLQT